MNENLDPRVIAAIITSIVSLVIAIISLIIGNKSAKTNARQQEDLTKLKSKLDKQLEKDKIEFQKNIDKNKAKIDLIREKTKTSLTSIENAIRYLQMIKSTLQQMLNTPLNKINIEETLANFTQAHNTFDKCYQSSMSHLNDRENETFHQAKDFSFKFKGYLLNVNFKAENNEEIPEDFHNQVQKCRAVFSEFQNTLRSYQIRRINELL